MFEKEAEVHCNKVLCSVCENPTCTKNIKCREWRDRKAGFYCGAEFGYNKANEWHYLRKNPHDLPNEGEWVEGLYIWYYKDKPYWDVFKVRWYYEIGELDEKLVRWYRSDENDSRERDYWNKVDEPDYWRKITLPMRNEYDRKY